MNELLKQSTTHKQVLIHLNAAPRSRHLRICAFVLGIIMECFVMSKCLCIAILS